ncbi:unnamed protein product [Paramecium octaurelia]|uniref:PUM-HD domain-containing protein n=1 Tax=Paramecium octaurelia TaxID=43137 RepID=A0A8S1WD90_PAROT|nr:unnamed protein product [Paramecium octaurelia]
MQETEQSEKDMIGSLLDEDESKCSEFRSSITKSQQHSQSQSPVKSFKDLKEAKEIPLLLDDAGQQEFPSNDPNNFYFTVQSAFIQQRQHSLSHEFHQYMVPQPPLYYPCQDGFFSQKRTKKLQSSADSEQTISQQCQDQYASLNIQQSFIQGNDFQKDKIFKALIEDLPLLAKHKFGNYVIQKIIENSNQNIRTLIFEQLHPFIIEMCYDKFGCRVIQRLLEFIQNHQKIQLIQSIKSQVLNLIFDQCGNHVIQKIIDLASDAEFIIDIVTNNVDHIVSHSYGCRIAQKCLEIFPNQKLQQLYISLIPLCEKLSFCQYGNYIVQHMINQGPPKGLEVIGKYIKARILEVSQDKYASIVAQKYITVANDDDIASICKILINDYYPPMLLILINNQFGNYVMQNFYQKCNDKQKQSIQIQINKFEDHQFTQFGRHFLQFLARCHAC